MSNIDRIVKCLQKRHDTTISAGDGTNLLSQERALSRCGLIKPCLRGSNPSWAQPLRQLETPVLPVRLTTSGTTSGWRQERDRARWVFNDFDLLSRRSTFTFRWYYSLFQHVLWSCMTDSPHPRPVSCTTSLYPTTTETPASMFGFSEMPLKLAVHYSDVQVTHEGATP